MASINSGSVSAASQPQVSDNLVSADSNPNVDQLLNNDGSQMSTKKDTNLYSQPNKNSNKLQDLNKFIHVELKKQSGKWMKVKVNNQKMYVPAKNVVQVATSDSNAVSLY